MKVNLPSKVRLALYLLTVLGSPVIAYLNLRGAIGSLEVGLWSAEVTVVSALAAFNVNTKKK